MLICPAVTCNPCCFRVQTELYKDLPGDLVAQGCLSVGNSAGAKPANPFLPYEEALWVEHLSDTHTLLLNKFNVVEHHLLVVTRKFESQLDRLNREDFEAVWKTIAVSSLACAGSDSV